MAKSKKFNLLVSAAKEVTETQLEHLRTLSRMRPLDMQEIKKLEILTKTLAVANGIEKEEATLAEDDEDVSEQDLLDIVNGKLPNVIEDKTSTEN